MLKLASTHVYTTCCFPVLHKNARQGFVTLSLFYSILGRVAMTHLYLFNPARKIRLMSRLLYQGSQRIFGSLGSTTRVLDNRPLPTKPPKYINLPIHVDRSQLTRDAEFFYSEETDHGFCVFRVENTLFKVGRVAFKECF